MSEQHVAKPCNRKVIVATVKTTKVTGAMADAFKRAVEK